MVEFLCERHENQLVRDILGGRFGSNLFGQQFEVLGCVIDEMVTRVAWAEIH
jgi:hypothetical protein